MVVSRELKTLFQSLINIFSIQNGVFDNEYFRELDSKKIIHLADYHNFKPILFQFFRDNNFETPINLSLLNNSRDLAVNNLFSSTEFVNVSKLLCGKKVDYLPYKGLLFLEKLYNGKQVRAIGDLDILVLPKEAPKILNLLLENGYKFHNVKSENKFSENQLIKIIPKTFGMNETTLRKTINAKNHYIDFHWGFHYSFLPYKINLEQLFEDKSTVNVNGVECVAPSDFAIFIMLIIHHGGRECWINLKYMADLMGFMENLRDKIDWEKMLLELEKMKLKRPALVGFFLLQEYFKYEIPEIISKSFEINKINHNLTDPIIDYWENCYNILSMKGRLKYERILWSIQDEGFSLRKYFYEMYKMYSIPNPIESKRLITFPENYYFLNALSKLLTYIYKRTGKIIR